MARVSKQQLPGFGVETCQESRGEPDPPGAFEKAIVELPDQRGLVPFSELLPRGVMQGTSRRADPLAVTGPIRYGDPGDNSVTASRQVIEVPAAWRRTQRVARNPGSKAGQIGGIYRQMISAAQLQ